MTEPIDQATKERIEKEAEELPMGNYRKGYIAGATVWAEKLKQERNKVIDECLIEFSKWLTDPLSLGNELTKKLESLKDKSHE